MEIKQQNNIIEIKITRNLADYRNAEAYCHRCIRLTKEIKDYLLRALAERMLRCEEGLMAIIKEEDATFSENEIYSNLAKHRFSLPAYEAMEETISDIMSVEDMNYDEFIHQLSTMQVLQLTKALSTYKEEKHFKVINATIDELGSR